MADEDVSIEAELIKACEFKPRRKYDNRQDYLAALARAVNDISQDVYDSLSNEAVDWFNEAARTLRDGRDIADFNTEISAAPEAEANGPEQEIEPEPQPAPKAAKAKGGKKAKKPLISASEIELDKYGIAVGSKNSQAVVMLEKSCKMQEVNDALGGTYYNLLRRLQRQGHHVDKLPHGIIRLIHADEYGAKARDNS